MKINYKEPYWVKYEWDLDENKDNQYVTEFNKKDSAKVHNLFHQNKYALNVEFKLNKRYKSDNIFCIFGKPGKNFGLTYNKEADILALEFWTQGSTKVSDDEFHYIKFYDTHYDSMKDWINITIVRNEDEFIVYKNFERNNDKDFEKNLIDVVKKIAETDSSNLNKLKEYKNIIFNHEFDTVNNEGIVFDNSENTFFAEKIPSFFIK